MSDLERWTAWEMHMKRVNGMFDGQFHKVTPEHKPVEEVYDEIYGQMSLDEFLDEVLTPYPEPDPED
jgi:hypothetical protein